MLISEGAGSDNIYVRDLDSLNPTIGVWTDATSGQGVPNQSFQVSSVSTLTVVGTGDDAALTIDFSGGAPAISSITWNSSGPLTIVGCSGANAIQIGSGQITFGAVPIYATSPSTVTIETATGTDVVSQTVPANPPVTVLTGTGQTSLNVAAGTIAIGPSEPGTNVISLGGLSLSGGATAKVLAPSQGAGPTVVDTAALSIDGTSRLNLTHNDLIIRNGDLSAATSLLQSGFYGGLWDGTGLMSTDAGAGFALSALGVTVNHDQDGDQIFGSGTTAGLFDGISPGFNDVLIKFTQYGDANLDGVVDGSDYTKIDNGFATNLTGWANGDLNYDGVVDGSDYTLIDNAFNTQTVAGFAAGWSYHVPIQLTGSDNAAVNNATIQVQLTASRFDFSMAGADGIDVRFVDSDGNTMLPFYRAAWDATASEATFYVKVPYFPVNSSKTIYILAGNPSAADASSYADTMQTPPVEVGTLANWPLSDGVGDAARDTTGNFPLTFPAGVSWNASGGPGYEGTGDGFSGSYVQLNGTDQYAQAAGLLDSPGADVTIAGWVRLDKIANQATWIWEKTENSANDYFNLYVQPSGQLVMQDEYGVVGTSTVLTAKTWYYVACEYGLDGYSVYVNGNLVGADLNNRNSPNVGPGTVPFTFGADTRFGAPRSFSALSLSDWMVDETDWTVGQVKAAFQGSSYLGTDERSKWVRSTPNPVITADPSLLQASSVQEPCPWYDPQDGLFKMIFTGGWAPSYLYFATSPDGVHWTQQGRVIGENNVYGNNNAGHASVYYDGSTVYCYFCGGTDIWLTTSTNGGYTWSPATDVISRSIFSWTAASQVANTDLVERGPGDYVMFIEGLAPGNIWETGELSAATPEGPFKPVQSDPISSLAYGPVFGGPDVHLINGVYHIWEHVVTGSGDLPSEIVDLSSTDLLNWTAVADNPVLGIEDPGFEYDQTADPALLSVNGVTYMWYSGLNNDTQVAAIGLVTYQGSLAQLVTDGTAGITVG